jgi:hypothetical protein
MLSPDGRCKTFDASANGYVRSEACVVVLLSNSSDRTLVSLSLAASNHDGLSNGLTAPSGSAQVRLLQSANVAELNILETHGTGTVLGDRVETQSVAEVVGKLFRKRAPLVLTACKSLLGHAEAASGLLSLVRAIGLPRTGLAIAHFHQLSATIGNALLEGANCVVPVEHVALSAGSAVVLGVSSFGMSGTNVHVVVKGPVLAAAPPTMLMSRSAVAPWSLQDLEDRSGLWLKEWGSAPPTCVWNLGQTMSHVVLGYSPKQSVVTMDLLETNQLQLVSVAGEFAASRLGLFRRLFRAANLPKSRNGIVSVEGAREIARAVELQLRRWNVNVTLEFSTVAMYTGRVSRRIRPRGQSVLYATGTRRGSSSFHPTFLAWACVERESNHHHHHHQYGAFDALLKIGDRGMDAKETVTVFFSFFFLFCATIFLFLSEQRFWTVLFPELFASFVKRFVTFSAWKHLPASMFLLLNLAQTL